MSFVKALKAKPKADFRAYANLYNNGMPDIVKSFAKSLGVDADGLNSSILDIKKSRDHLFYEIKFTNSDSARQFHDKLLEKHVYGDESSLNEVSVTMRASSEEAQLLRTTANQLKDFSKNDNSAYL